MDCKVVCLSTDLLGSNKLAYWYPQQREHGQDRNILTSASTQTSSKSSGTFLQQKLPGIRINILPVAETKDRAHHLRELNIIWAHTNVYNSIYLYSIYLSGERERERESFFKIGFPKTKLNSKIWQSLTIPYHKLYIAHTTNRQA